MSKPLPWLEARLAEAAHDELLRAKTVCEPDRGAGIIVDGQPLQNFAGNDYLNLASDPRLRAAVERQLDFSGIGATASALVIGRGPAQRDLEDRLAAFERQEAAIVFPTGYAANVGTIAALVRADDIVFCDRFNHASLVDGCRLSGAKFRVYRHDDLETLERALKKTGDSASRRWIVTESIFSMDGDVAPLGELCDLADRYGAELIVDEAHATGVYGLRGRGVAVYMNVAHRIAVRVGTLSKAIGCQGGFAVGAKSTIDWLWNNARTQMFSTSLSPLMCAAALVAIDIIENEPERRDRLQENVDVWRSIMASDEIAAARLSPTANGPIQPVLIGEPGPTMEMARRLKEHGVLVAAIRPPTVPHHTSRLRISFSCAHSIKYVERMARTLIVELRSVQASNAGVRHDS